jgi:hypothetical protein
MAINSTKTNFDYPSYEPLKEHRPLNEIIKEVEKNSHNSKTASGLKE